MPYIKRELRERVEPEFKIFKEKINKIIETDPTIRAGLMNYLFTSMLDNCYGPLESARYNDYNEIMGMLECCKMEFYRKAIIPYENWKERENGKVLDENHSKSKKNSKSKTNSNSNNEQEFNLYLL